MAVKEQRGIPGKQVYALDTVTGFARMEVTGVGGGSVTSAGVVSSTPVSGVLTNTTSSVFTAPSGAKTFYGEVVGTGTVTQTQAIYGTPYSTAINGILLGTITLSGTTRAQDALPPITANFTNYYVITTATTGTSATGAVYLMY